MHQEMRGLAVAAAGTSSGSHDAPGRTTGRRRRRRERRFAGGAAAGEEDAGLARCCRPGGRASARTRGCPEAQADQV